MRTVKNAAGILLFALAAYVLATAVKDLVLSLRSGGPGAGVAGLEAFGAMLVELGAVLLLFLIGALLTREHLDKRGPRTALWTVAILMVLWGTAAAYL